MRYHSFMNLLQLVAELDEVLDADAVKDSCPNGLQVEGKPDVSRVITAVAISRTAGHLFEERLIASGGTTARDPHVAVRGKAVVVGWSDFASPNADPVFKIRRAVVQ